MKAERPQGRSAFLHLGSRRRVRYSLIAPPGVPTITGAAAPERGR